MGFACALIGEVGGEYGFTGKHAFAGREQLAHEAFIGIRAVAHSGIEGDALLHVSHGACFGNHGFPRIQFNFHQLHFRANDPVVNFVATHELLLGVLA